MKQKPPQVAAPHVQGAKHGPIPKKTAQVHHVTAEEAILDDGVIAGKLRINSISARVLFDPGASHSFMHERYVQENEFSTMDFGRGF